MPNWRQTTGMREAGLKHGFQGSNESNEDFAARVALEAMLVDEHGRELVDEHQADDDEADDERDRRRRLLPWP